MFFNSALIRLYVNTARRNMLIQLGDVNILSVQLIILEQDTKRIIAVKKSFYYMSTEVYSSIWLCVIIVRN